jgi:hypothetical protein
MPSVDLSTIRPGSRVKLRGPDKDKAPNKPYPLGWRRVNYTDGDGQSPTRAIVVTGDDRWIPVELVTEIKNSA